MSVDEEYQVSDDAAVVYQGMSTVMSFGRNSVSGSWLKLSATDEAQFTAAIESGCSGPVYVTISTDSDLYLSNHEFLLKAASSSSRAGNSFRLEYAVHDSDIYDQVALWSDKDVELQVLIIKGEVAKVDADEVGEYADHSRRIRQSPALIDQNFLALVGAEEEYITWLQEQKCCLSGQFYKDSETGRELCEAAHVRTLTGGAGTGTKPAYHAVPLHHKLHRWQHDHSMTELWFRNRYGKGIPSNKNYRRMAPDAEYPVQSASMAAHAFFMHLVHSYNRRWVEHRIIQWAGVTRLSYVSPEKFHSWMCDIGAEDWTV